MNFKRNSQYILIPLWLAAVATPFALIGWSGKYYFNIYALGTLLTSYFVGALGILIAAKGLEQKDRQQLFLLSLWFFIWLWAVGIAELCKSGNDALSAAWCRAANIGVVFSPMQLYAFSVAFLKLERRKSIIVGYLVGSVFAVLDLTTRYLVSGMQWFRWGYYPRWQIRTLPFMVYFSIGLGLTLTEFIRAYRHSQNEHLKNQIKYILVSLGISYFGSVDYLAAFGYKVYPCGYVAIFGWWTVLAYAILKHRLMDITIIIRKTLIYSLVTGALTVIYFSIVAILAHVLQGWMKSANLLAYLAACVITFLFHPLRTKIQVFVDRRFSRDATDRQERLLELSNEITHQKDPERLAEALFRVLEQALHPHWRVLYLRLEDQEEFQQMPVEGGADTRASADNLWASYFNQGGEPVFLNPFSSNEGDLIGPPDELAREMRSKGIMAAFPLMSLGSLFGYLLLGPKKSDEPYTGDDSMLLRNAINQMTLGYERYLLDKGLQKAPEALETMASSFVHEIKTPMANILLPADLMLRYLKDVEDGRREWSAVVPTFRKHLEYIRAQSFAASDKIEAIRQMSKKQGPFEKLSMKQVINDALANLDQLVIRSQVQLEVCVSDELPAIYGNARQLGIVFMNLIKNGIEAMGGNSADAKPNALRVEAQETRDGIEISVEDKGPGIPAENMNRLFNAYFSTKGSTGTGIGLFLSQEVMKAHGGSISVKSEVGKGTSFIVRLPAWNPA